MNLKNFFYAFLIFFLCSSGANEEVIYLSVGLQNDFVLDSSFSGKKITFEGSYNNYTRLEYNSQTQTIRFSPRAAGTGTLHIKEGKNILKKYTVNVVKVDLNRVISEVRGLLIEIDGINIKILNNKVVIDGEISVLDDMKRIFDVVEEYGNSVTSLVTLSKSAQNRIAQFMEQEIGNPNITVRAANEKFILRGVVSKKAERNEAERIAELYAPGIAKEGAVRGGTVQDRVSKKIIINLIKVEEPSEVKKQKKLILLVVHYIEFDKNYENFFRFQFSPGIEDNTTIQVGQTGTGEIFKSLTATINNFIPKLNWAKSFGFARILHASNIIVEDGGSGSIQADVDYPYRSTNAEGQINVDTKSIGIQGTIKAQVGGSRQDGVNLSIQGFRIRNLLGIVEGVPLTSTRTISTSLFVRSGQSAAVGGVVSSVNSSGYNRAPSGSKTTGDPLINLLASKEFNKKQNQFVIFVTPSIRSSASTGVEDIKRKFRID